MNVEVGGLAVHDVSEVVGGRDFEVEHVARGARQVGDRSGRATVVEVVQYAMTHHEVKWSSGRPFSDVTSLVPEFAAGVFADVNGRHAHPGVVLAVPVAPPSRSGTDVEHRTHRRVPPCAHRVHCGRQGCNRATIVHRIECVEPSVIRIVKTRARHASRCSRSGVTLDRIRAKGRARA